MPDVTYPIPPIYGMLIRIPEDAPLSGPFPFQIPFNATNVLVALAATGQALLIQDQVDEDGDDVADPVDPTSATWATGPAITPGAITNNYFLTGSVAILGLDTTTRAIVLNLTIPLELTMLDSSTAQTFEIQHSRTITDPSDEDDPLDVGLTFKMATAMDYGFVAPTLNGDPVNFPDSDYATAEVDFPIERRVPSFRPFLYDVGVDVPITVESSNTPSPGTTFLAVVFSLKMIFGPQLAPPV